MFTFVLLMRYGNSSLEPSAQVERVGKKSKNKINKSVPDNRQRKKERKKHKQKSKCLVHVSCPAPPRPFPPINGCALNRVMDKYL